MIIPIIFELLVIWTSRVWASLTLGQKLAEVINLANCDVALSAQSTQKWEEDQTVIRDIGKHIIHPQTITDIDQILQDATIEPRTNHRCETIVILTNNQKSLKQYLTIMDKQQLVHKRQKHIFITSNVNTILEEVFSIEAFQYHAHTVVLSFNVSECFGSPKICPICGHVFDTFQTFKPKLYISTFTTQKLTYKDVFPDMLANMQDYEYIVATLHYAPFILEHSENRYSGLEVSLAGYLAEKYKFRFRLIKPPDGAWGRPDDNGTWSGLIGQCLYRHSNWSMSGIAVSPEREEVIDFAYHYTPEYFDWVAPVPRLNPTWPAIFKPFSVLTWLLILLTTVIAGLVLNFLGHYSSPDALSHIQDLGNAYLFIVSALLKDVHIDNRNLPRRKSPRIFLISWWIFTLIIFTAYTGNLVAFMTLPGIQSALDTPAKVLEADLPVAMYNYEGSTTIAFSGTKNPLYQSIWKGKQWISNFDQTYAQVERGDMIFMDYRFALEAAVEAQYVDALGRPRLHLAKYNTFRFGTAWAVQPQSMFIEALNHGTLIAEMTGHLIHWKRRTLFQMKADANGQSITIPSEVVAKPLTIGDLQGPILMYCLCIGSACIAFCLESMHGKAKKTQDWHRRAQISMGC